MRPRLNKRQRQALEDLRDRFISDHINGYVEHGVRHDPVSPEEANRLWELQDIGRWERVLFDPDVISRLDLAHDEPIPAELIKRISARPTNPA